jgi:hypothetical protein
VKPSRYVIMEVNYSYLRIARRPLHSIFVLIVSFQLGFGLNCSRTRFRRCRWLPLTHRFTPHSLYFSWTRTRSSSKDTGGSPNPTLTYLSSNDADHGRYLPPDAHSGTVPSFLTSVSG